MQIDRIRIRQYLGSYALNIIHISPHLPDDKSKTLIRGYPRVIRVSIATQSGTLRASLLHT